MSAQGHEQQQQIKSQWCCCWFEIDATYIDNSMFPTEFTELGQFMNITAICYSCKVVGQYCKRYNKGLIEMNVIYQKIMKRLREENIALFDYLPFILDKTLFQSFFENDDNTYPLEEWRGNLIGKKACGDRTFLLFLIFKSNVQTLREIQSLEN